MLSMLAPLSKVPRKSIFNVESIGNRQIIQLEW